MATSDTDLQQIEVLWDRFRERLATDPSIRITDFAAEYPESAEEIQRVFPVMRELDSLAEHSSEPDIPELVGRYPIVSRIAVGGMGVVYEARCDALRERIALKVISAERLDPKNIKRFEQEARAVASLHHTNIVPIYEFAEEDGHYYYTMRYIDGPNLAEVTRIAELSAQEEPVEFGDVDVRAYQLLAKLAGNWGYIADLGHQAALALEHAHSKEVLHRDIKPANLLVDNSDKLWVTDFGLAKRVVGEHELTSIFQTVGTPRYMAPEQAKGHADHRSDIYSLGLTLHELVTLQTGEAPYRHSGIETPPAPRTINSRVPAELNQIIVKAIQPNPSDRYQTARELAADLVKVAQQYRTTEDREPTSIWPWAIGAGLLLAIAAMLMFLWRPATVAAPSPTRLPVVQVSEGEMVVRGIPSGLLSQQNSEMAGPDARHFEIDEASGQLQFVLPTDFEVPLDADMDNVYEIDFKTTSGTVTHEVRIEVSNVNESPSIDPFVFEQDGETIHLSGDQLSRAWVLGVEDDQNDPFNGLFFELVGGPDRPLVNMTPQGVFVFDRRIAEGQIVDANRDGVIEVELAVTDETQSWLGRLEEQPDGKIALLRERIVAGAKLETEELSEDCLIRRDVIDFATADGETFFHIHPSGDGVALFRSTLTDEMTFRSSLLNDRCGLPSETIGLATLDGTQFFAVLRIQGNMNSTAMLSGTLLDDGTLELEPMTVRSGIPISVAGFSCLDETRFHHIRNDAFGQARLYFSFFSQRFANMPLSADQPQFQSNCRGQAAWISRGPSSQAVVKPIRFDTQAR